MSKLITLLTAYCACCILCLQLQAQVHATLNATLDGNKYPYEVKHLPVSVEGEPYNMAYMDVPPSNRAQNPQTILLLHGKNFFWAYWGQTIKFLSDNGLRLIVPDQIGFGKSEKPEVYYNFHQLAENTKALLEHVGVQQVAGHSMGGMLATRFALLYPEMTTKLVLENPIGLEDYRLFVPYKNLEELYQAELKRDRRRHPGVPQVLLYLLEACL